MIKHVQTHTLLHPARSVFLLAGLALTGLLGCEEEECGQTSIDIGNASGELLHVPSGIRCLQLTLTGAESRLARFDLTPGEGPVFLDLGPTRAGSLTVEPEAFDVVCDDITSSSPPRIVPPPRTLSIGAFAHTSFELQL